MRFNSIHRITTVLAGLCLFLTACGGSGSGTTPAGAANCSGTLSAGFRIVEYLPGLKAALWYPTTQAASAYTYAGQAAEIGQVALNAPVASCAQFPLIVFSHGDTGCGTQSLFITEELARRGYIVMAPDHLDALCSVDGGPSRGPDPNNEPSFARPQDWTDQSHIDRHTDIENVMTWLLSQPDLTPQIDQTRIGIMGHSLGGYTALAIAGGWDNWRDTRFKTALLLSPFLTPFLETGALSSKVNRPLMYQGGTLDTGITPYIKGPTPAFPAGGAYAASNPPKYFAEIQGAGHFYWTNATCASSATLQACYTDQPNAALLVQYGAAFLDQYLQGLTQPLLGSGPAFADYEFQLSP